MRNPKELVDYFECKRGREVRHFSMFGCNYVFGLRDMILKFRRQRERPSEPYPRLLQLTTAMGRLELGDGKEGSVQASCACPGHSSATVQGQCVVRGMTPFFQLFRRLSQVTGARGRSQMS